MSTVIGTVVIQTTDSNCPCEHLENIPSYKNKLLLVVAVMHHIWELLLQLLCFCLSVREGACGRREGIP